MKFLDYQGLKTFLANLLQKIAIAFDDLDARVESIQKTNVNNITLNEESITIKQTYDSENQTITASIDNVKQIENNNDEIYVYCYLILIIMIILLI